MKRLKRTSPAIVDVLNDGRHWRWRYLDEEAGVELLSNEEYETETEARRSAATAYPDVPFADSETAHHEAGSDGGRRHFVVAALLCLLVVGLLLVIVRSE